jgi:hypothetical protein
VYSRAATAEAVAARFFRESGMPLLDHFHPPLSTARHWESFHSRWANAIADFLNRTLPPDYFAEAQTHVGPRIEIDVATLHNDPPATGGIVTIPRTQPVLSPPELVIPAVFPPGFTVNVYETSGGPTLVAAVELVSPGNKDRDETRRAFAAKCAAYLQHGQGLIVVYVVTNRLGRPLDDLLTLLDPTTVPPATDPLTAVSYRPIRVGDADRIELRIRSLAVGGVLPELPLSLDAGRVVPVNLEASYEDARARSRL